MTVKHNPTIEDAINILNHVVEYYDMNYDQGKKESIETNNAWKSLDVLIKNQKISEQKG
tara:strand:- start:672 stop:848 length:177 start_codon:yes stop_codon:yes gene_type:complete